MVNIKYKSMTINKKQTWSKNQLEHTHENDINWKWNNDKMNVNLNERMYTNGIITLNENEIKIEIKLGISK